ncbi:ACT domain-containing protein [Candidatus Micrarchaeota archaeon]|nr:ACT domain-containing protein [Candidatus Micrarchaeota archaeon]
MLDPITYLKNGTFYIWKEDFAVVQSKHVQDAFAIIHDKNPITLVIDQTKIHEENIIKIEREWKLITFDMVLPFELVGFFAAVSQALAEETISIFAISAFSTDHILVKKTFVYMPCSMFNNKFSAQCLSHFLSFF